MKSLSKTFPIAVLSVVALGMGGCATNNGDYSLQGNTTNMLGTTAGGAVVGTGFGAGLGVGIAALLSTNPWTGAIVGAGVGLLAGTAGGAAIGHEMDQCQGISK